MSAGTVSCPYWLEPQHTTVPLARSPQAWRIPTASSLNVSVAGMVDTWPASSAPQHTGLLSVRRAQAKLNPGATCVNDPVGTLETFPLVSLPQHAMVRVMVTPQPVL